MGREWKPGDVAVCTDGEPETVLRSDDNDGWVFGDASYEPGNDAWVTVRPLVKIDPEDREQVERLWHAFRDHGSPVAVDAMQAALRSLTAPPKPAEPTGLGAVVEEADGRLWVRVADEHTHPWQSTDKIGQQRAPWSGFDAVLVHDEGWSE